MRAPLDAEFCEAFLAVARVRGLLADEQARQLAEEAARLSVTPAQLAVQQGLLSPVDVEIVEAFIDPRDLAPGYELLDVVGHGALGVVYRARQPHLHRDVAIKAILQSRTSQPNVAARFKQEGALIGRLQHPNIVSAYDFGTHRNRLYLVMELVSGVDLSRRLEETTYPITTAVSILRQTAAGLAHAHSHRIIHRDIKPGNLLLTDAPAGFDLPPGVPLVKIADFGLARFHQSPDIDDQDTRLTLGGTALGTPMYCAPEQLSGDDVDHRADIYALGATFFRVLSGQPPFASEKVSKLIAAKVTGQPPRLELLPSDTPPAIRSLLLDMMHADPDQRIGDYQSLIERVDALDSTRRVSAPSPDRSPLNPAPSGSLRRPISRGMLATLGILLLGIAATGLTAWMRGPAVPSLVRSGWEDHLFDGKTMSGWRVRRGLWSSGVDSEGGAILIGKGAAIRVLPKPPATLATDAPGIGLRMGIDLQQAASAEVHFAIDGEPTDETPRLAVQLASQGVRLGSKASVDAELVPAGPSVKMPVHLNETPADSEDQPRYHEVRVERHGAHWFAFFDDQSLGSLPADEGESDHVIELVTDGTVHFEGPIVYWLLAPSRTAGPNP